MLEKLNSRIRNNDISIYYIYRYNCLFDTEDEVTFVRRQKEQSNDYIDRAGDDTLIKIV